MFKRFNSISKCIKLHNIVICIGILICCVTLFFAVSIYIKFNKEENTAKINEQKLLNLISDNSESSTENNANTKADTKKVIPSLAGCEIIGKLEVKKINLESAIISKFSYNALHMSVCYYQGPTSPKEEGNMVVVGHNYRNGSQFGNLHKLCKGDMLIFTDMNGNEYNYKTYEIVTVLPENVEALNDHADFHNKLTLLTCCENANRRLIVRLYQV